MREKLNYSEIIFKNCVDFIDKFVGEVHIFCLGRNFVNVYFPKRNRTLNVQYRTVFRYLFILET